MALLYPWATKEYLLWEMSLGQIVLYFNLGMELKYPDPNKSTGTLSGKSQRELRRIRQQMVKDGLIEEKNESDASPEHAALAAKYGHIED